MADKHKTQFWKIKFKYISIITINPYELISINKNSCHGRDIFKTNIELKRKKVI